MLMVTLGQTRERGACPDAAESPDDEDDDGDDWISVWNRVERPFRNSELGAQ